MHEFNPLRRGVEAGQVAAAVRFLAATPTMTGEVLNIDGGQRFWSLSRDVQYLSPYGDSAVSESK
jgi:enoyl-[acyl-carrier-protein] reductase (NADH)